MEGCLSFVIAIILLIVFIIFIGGIGNIGAWFYSLFHPQPDEPDIIPTEPIARQEIIIPTEPQTNPRLSELKFNDSSYQATDDRKGTAFLIESVITDTDGKQHLEVLIPRDQLQDGYNGYQLNQKYKRIQGTIFLREKTAEYPYEGDTKIEFRINRETTGRTFQFNENTPSQTISIDLSDAEYLEVIYHNGSIPVGIDAMLIDNENEEAQDSQENAQ